MENYYYDRKAIITFADKTGDSCVEVMISAINTLLLSTLRSGELSRGTYNSTSLVENVLFCAEHLSESIYSAVLVTCVI